MTQAVNTLAGIITKYVEREAPSEKVYNMALQRVDSVIEQGQPLDEAINECRIYLEGFRAKVAQGLNNLDALFVDEGGLDAAIENAQLVVAILMELEMAQCVTK